MAQYVRGTTIFAKMMFCSSEVVTTSRASLSRVSHRMFFAEAAPNQSHPSRQLAVVFLVGWRFFYRLLHILVRSTNF